MLFPPVRVEGVFSVQFVGEVDHVQKKKAINVGEFLNCFIFNLRKRALVLAFSMSTLLCKISLICCRHKIMNVS